MPQGIKSNTRVNTFQYNFKSKLSDHVRSVIATDQRFNVSLLNDLKTGLATGQVPQSTLDTSITDEEGTSYIMCGFSTIGNADQCAPGSTSP
jgi:hypothetical protein